MHEVWLRGRRERMIIRVKLEIMPTFFQADINTIDKRCIDSEMAPQL
jgi:hypothetical protein